MVSESTVTTYVRAVHRLEVWAGKPAHEVTVDDVAGYLKSDITHSVRQQSFVAYRLFHHWGALHKLWPLDAEIIDIRFPKVRHGPMPSLDREDARNLLAVAATPIEVRFAYLGLYTGLRLAEICALDRDGWSGGVISATVKGGWIHRLPVHSELAERRDEILSVIPHRRQVQRPRIGCGGSLTCPSPLTGCGGRLPSSSAGARE
jgi:integrase